MNYRKLSGWGFILLVFLLALFSYIGNKTFFYLFMALIFPFGLLHVIFLCSKCTNVCCPFNSNSPDFIFSSGPAPRRIMVGNSDIDTQWALVPLGLILTIPYIAVWQMNPAIFFPLFIFGVIVIVLYQKESCRFCTNNCRLNGNEEYWIWKKRQKRKTPKT